ncbi:hypothetical protein [Paraburkholderia sp. 2C]
MTIEERGRAAGSPRDEGVRSPRAHATGGRAVAAPTGISGRACREFEASLAKLQAVTERMQHTEDADGIDSIAFARALENYQRARLVWLSNDIMLRSNAVCMPVRAPAPERVLSLQYAEPVAASYEILLRINGYPVMSLDGLAGLDALLDRFAPQVVLLDLDERFGMKLACVVRAREWQRRERPEGRGDIRIVGLASPRLAQLHVPLVDVMIGKPAQFGELIDAFHVS